MSLTQDLVEILSRPISAQDRARAVCHIIDWLGVASIGATAPAGRSLSEYGRRQTAGSSHVFGVGRRSAETAAFVNAGLGNIFEMDDLHRTSIVHAGDVVVPAALSVAEREGSTGTALLDAIIRGYEAAIRIGIGAGRGHYQLWYNTATCGVFGSAAAVASLLGLNRDITVHALGQAGAMSSGTWQCRIEPTDTKQVLTARAAQSGLIAADLAATGLKGPQQILEGSHGLFAAAAPGADGRQVVADTTAPWKIHDVSFKPWSACRHTHPMIEAALALRDEIAVEEIDVIEIQSYAEALDFCDNSVPATPHEARFSLQYCAATAILNGPPRMEDFSPSAITSPETLLLASKVSLAEDVEFTQNFPRCYGASMKVCSKNGGTRTKTVATALGDPENPMSKEDLVSKSRRLIAMAGYDLEAADTSIAACHALLDDGSPGNILSALIGSDNSQSSKVERKK